MQAVSGDLYTGGSLSDGTPVYELRSAVDPKGTSVLVGGASLDCWAAGLIWRSRRHAWTVLPLGEPVRPPAVHNQGFHSVSQGGAINSLVSVIDTANTAFLRGNDGLRR